MTKIFLLALILIGSIFSARAQSQGNANRINYSITGSGDTTLLFIHGWNISQQYWSNQVEKLAGRFKIVTLDLPGHGLSPKVNSYQTPEAMVQEITKLIFQENLETIVVIGHSLGGELALLLWTQVPQKIVGIIGVDNFKDIQFKITPQFQKGFDDYFKKFQHDYSNMAEQFARENIRSTDSLVVQRIVRDYRSADPKVALTIFKAMMPTYENDKAILKALPFPLHIIASDYEPSNEEALGAYSKSGYWIEWINHAGHFPMVEQPEQFQQAMELTLAHINKSKNR
jgi:sigma-B regulation protein RsbQ